MKLEKIKLSGFKSFVDPTTIPISGNLIGIVGPNGCGKSNIIDAVRWVMGESSAKHLRGGQMADVIFNGSSTRQPVSTASVELVFDNSEGRVGGEFAKYNTLAIKRQVSRDGQSAYLLNGTRCRRKDITDLFLGTGLGSRSYAIIEQGTISRMVEAKPEELRIHIEEAAGVSKYKERRHETEIRMRHTRENLERLNDVREEVEKQLKHLHKQAQKAEKYTQLKKQERQYKVELLAMRWNKHHQSAQALEQKLQAVAQAHNQLFMQLREIDRDVDGRRELQKQQQKQLEQVQGEFYDVVSEVSRLEQAISHHQRSRQEMGEEIDRLGQQAAQFVAEMEQDKQQLEEIRQSQLETEQSLVSARSAAELHIQEQQQLREQRSAWQQQWETFRNETAELREQVEVQRSKIGQLENQQQQYQVRLHKLESERGELNGSQLQREIAALDQSIETIESERSLMHQQLDALNQLIDEQRRRVKQLHDQLHNLRSELHGVKGKVTSLELLQQHAMGKDNKKLTRWLGQMSLVENKRLAEYLEVESGWEKAAETVLSAYLEAICVEDAGPLLDGLNTLSEQSLTLFETRIDTAVVEKGRLPRLLDKIDTPWNLNSLLVGVYCADDEHAVRELSAQLSDHESIITPQGTWLGPGWLKIVHPGDGKAGVLQREKELRLLKEHQLQLQEQITLSEQALEEAELQLQEAEIRRETLQRQDKAMGVELSAKNAEFSACSAKLEHEQRRLEQVVDEIEDLHRDVAENAELLAESSLLKEQAEQALQNSEQKQGQLQQLEQTLQHQLQQIEQSVHESQQQVHRLQARLESLQASEQMTDKQLLRLQQQHRQASDRIRDLQTRLQQTLTPLDDEQFELQALRLQKDQLEATLKQERATLEQTEASVSQLSEEHVRVQRELEKQKERLDSIRFEQQESSVRQQTVTEQLNEIDADAEQILATLSEQAEESAWKQKVDDLGRQIERLGTINLTAIEEYQAQSERMRFLDEQHQDLTSALATLEQAIDKIDKESRQRFKETFDKINNGLQVKFPKLFGGGQAYLELTEQDLLEAGVNIVARPPGKRNSSIHLLSGGEKALTAVALVFSIFDLNPAPFCLLDEVDAPLDDANVGRFSKMVEEMSASVQFLYISHNKVTMEIAKQLAGVTMKEPGVSRMVAVDIDEAVDLAES